MSLNHSSPSPELADTAVGFSCVSLAPQPGVARLALSGELDLSAAPRLGDALSNVADDAVLEFVRAPDDDRQPWNADDANPV
jgi:hypothetical protein